MRLIADPAAGDAPDFRTVYAYLSPCNKFFGQVALAADGAILAPAGCPISNWVASADEMLLKNASGGPEARLYRAGPAWLGRLEAQRLPVGLIPILSLPPAQTLSARRPILINATLNSGTYLAERWLSELGWAPTRLHLLTDGAIDDYRHAPDAEILAHPTRRRIHCRFGALAAILGPGDLLVGHLPAEADSAPFHNANVLQILIQRDLREILANLYSFKLARVPPISPADALWRSIPDPKSQFAAFLAFFADRDIAMLRRHATLFGEKNAFAYEDLVKGELPPRLAADIAGYAGVSEPEVAAALTRALAADTPVRTHQPHLSWDDVASPQAQNFFKAAGLAAINRNLGYLS